ncbi:MAG: hypothetical protein KBT33_03970 [Prevotellaceae bacterium]|nr:hypothetical protein [Candidatus Minthosoma equi]
MNQEDVDKIIAEAVADSKKQSAAKWHKGGKGSKDSVLTARKVLNWAFMIGGLAAVILYFACPENKVLFFSVGFGAVVLKLVEFYLRFMF